MRGRVLITGATGALGQALIAHLTTNKTDLDIFAPSRSEGLEQLDLRNQSQIVRTIERTQPDLIMHLAATFSNDFNEAYAINVSAAQHMLKVIQESAPLTRIVLIGSAAEYGLVSAHENPIAEERVLRPVSIYGVTKAWQTELAYMYAIRGVNVVVARIFNLIGPCLSERLFIGRLHKQIEELRSGSRAKIEVGSLSAIRDYISINDAITQLLAIADFGEAGEVYHVANGQPITMHELLARELAAHGLDESVVIEDAELSNRRGYDVPSIYADISKTTELLNKLGGYVKN